MGALKSEPKRNDLPPAKKYEVIKEAQKSKVGICKLPVTNTGGHVATCITWQYRGSCGYNLAVQGVM